MPESAPELAPELAHELAYAYSWRNATGKQTEEQINFFVRSNNTPIKGDKPLISAHVYVCVCICLPTMPIKVYSIVIFSITPVSLSSILSAGERSGRKVATQ